MVALVVPFGTTLVAMISGEWLRLLGHITPSGDRNLEG